MQDNGIPFHVIAVITGPALDHAQQIYEFFESAGVEQLGFNIEEVEADHAVSTLDAAHAERVREFYETIDALETSKFRQVLADIQAGIKRCAETCFYYGYCGGGAPANKYYENGSFSSTQTLYCRYAVQMPLDIVLTDIERTLSV